MDDFKINMIHVCIQKPNPKIFLCTQNNYFKGQGKMKCVSFSMGANF